jgi:hypothetical protein
MPRTPAQIDAMDDYTDAQLLKLYRAALVAIAENQSYTVSGRTLTRADGDFVKSMIDWLEDRIEQTTAGEQGGNVLVKYGERV